MALESLSVQNARELVNYQATEVITYVLCAMGLLVRLVRHAVARVKCEETKIMTEFQRSCWNCDEPFELNLPEGTVRAGYEECDNDDVKHHNLERKVECKNCHEISTFYYCTGGHSEDLFPN
jgi:hypothetical protein